MRDRIFRMFRKYTIQKLILLFLAVYILSKGISYIPTLQIKREKLPDLKTELSPSLGLVEVTNGEVLVAENDTKRLYFNMDNMNLKVEDKNGSMVWNSIYNSGSVDEQSLIKISYIGKSDTSIDWDSYTYSTIGKTYSLEKIKDGIRININMKEASSYRLNEYMPQKISIGRYESVFVEGLNKKAEEGILTLEDVDMYKMTLSLVYVIDEANDCYYSRYAIAPPPISMVLQLIEITKILGYDSEQLIEDNAEFDINTSFLETAEFVIPLEAVLDGNDFIIRIPTNQIQTINPYYTISHIDLLPYFGSVMASDVLDGWILVPDGTGALLEMNGYNSNYSTYNRSLYYNTYYKDYYRMNLYKEDLSMPLFGMIYGKESVGGFLGIIEDGDETAFIKAAVASLKDGEGGKINRVNAGVDTVQQERVSLQHPWSSDGGGFLVHTGLLDIDITIRYKLYSEPVTYYDMAKDYQDYLISKYQLKKEYSIEHKIFLDVIGSLTLVGNVAGVTYDDIVSMTTYKELQAILEDIKDIPAIVNYMGIFNNGIENSVLNKADITSQNGSKEELNQLLDFALNNQKEIFLQADISKVYKEGKGFKSGTHALYSAYGWPAFHLTYNYAYKEMWEPLHDYFVMNPVYLSSVVDGFIKDSKEYENLYIGDLASRFYANYRKNDIVSPAQAQVIVDENLKKLSNVKTLALYNPNIEKIIYGKYAVDISRESSGYGMIAAQIPFRQLVMNGLIEYTTLNINESPDWNDYFLLQALELSSIPKYTITSKNLDILKNTIYDDTILSREYSQLKNDIKGFYEKYHDAVSQINSSEITNHIILEDNVFETTYANGVKVITNYNKYSITLNSGLTLDALGYEIIK